MSELQTDITCPAFDDPFGDNTILGILRYQDNYTGFSDIASQQEGVFLALDIHANLEGASYTVDVLENGILSQDTTIVVDNGITVLRLNATVGSLIHISVVLNGNETVYQYYLEWLVVTGAPHIPPPVNMTN